MNWLLIVIIVALIGSALNAGMFFGFSTFIMQGLKKLEAPEEIRAMQWINITVMNPLTMGVFIGSAILSVGLIAYAIWSWAQPWSILLITAAAFNVIGNFATTAIGNVPLNEKLKVMDSETEEAADFWQLYLKRWMIWNYVRTINSTVSTILYVFVFSTLHV